MVPQEPKHTHSHTARGGAGDGGCGAKVSELKEWLRAGWLVRCGTQKQIPLPPPLLSFVPIIIILLRKHYSEGGRRGWLGGGGWFANGHAAAHFAHLCKYTLTHSTYTPFISSIWPPSTSSSSSLPMNTQVHTHTHHLSPTHKIEI